MIYLKGINEVKFDLRFYIFFLKHTKSCLYGAIRNQYS